MQYKEFVEIYENLAGTTKKLEKTSFLAGFFKKLDKEGKKQWVYLLKGKVFADYDSREFGISHQLVIKAMANAFGIKNEDIVERFKKTGDLGDIAEEVSKIRKQRALFFSKLDVEKVFENLRKIAEIEGKKAVERKISLIAELLNSASGKEAKYIVRTLLGDLRIGVADALIIDSIWEGFFKREEGMKEILEEKYDMINDYAVIFEAAVLGKEAIDKINIVLGKPIKVMLAVSVETMEDAFRICGKPAAIEYKYDGFRALIHKNKNEITIFTRKLENVTKQFPDVVEATRKYVRGESFILDAEIVGYNSINKKYLPFEAISQRIRRKYEIEKLVTNIPVEITVFDILYYNGKSFIQEEFVNRRKIIVKIINEKEWKIKVANQIIAQDEKEAEKFYRNALKIGEEGIMIKSLHSPYKQGRKVGYMAKLKPSNQELDLVIVGAEYGTGKRAGWLTSYVVACKKNSEFFEVGMVSSGLKEKEEEGTSYDEMTKLLKPLIIDEDGNKIKVKPKIVVSVIYQNIQPSPSYGSGYALRFPRIKLYRPDRNISDIANLEDIERLVKKQR